MYAVPVLVDNYGSANTGRLFLIQISAEKAGVCKTCTKINNSTNSKCYESYTRDITISHVLVLQCMKHR